MDIVTNPKIDWLGKKWYFIGLSLLLAVIGAASLLTKGLNLGVDFTGGTLVYVKFTSTPDLAVIRNALNKGELEAEEVTRFDEPSDNEVQIRMARVEGDEAQDLSVQSKLITQALFKQFDKDVGAGKIDLNSATVSQIATWLQEKDPEGLGGKMSIDEFAAHTREQATQIVDFRTAHGGLITNLSELDQLNLPASVTSAIKDNFYAGAFTVLSVESVGPKVGRELRDRAQNAVLFSLLGMLVYIAFRFQPIYGVAAIIALFHDVFLTVGFFSLTGKEISLTVIAALLTLVGYSINDTIVVFDRVRENLRLMRRSDFLTVVNASINQTLNRTILTSGMTFLAVFSLFMLGGEALSGFSFALVVGIIVGTYSSIAIASPIVLWWQNHREKRKA
ncbi:MAG: protein translocase subunit SecF [Acidobacteriota bacterium]